MNGGHGIPLEKVREKLVVAVSKTPHYIDQTFAYMPLTGDEPHAADCPGCAVTEALVELQEVIDRG